MQQSKRANSNTLGFVLCPELLPRSLALLRHSNTLGFVLCPEPTELITLSGGNSNTLGFVLCPEPPCARCCAPYDSEERLHNLSLAITSRQ